MSEIEMGIWRIIVIIDITQGRVIIVAIADMVVNLWIVIVVVGSSWVVVVVVVVVIVISTLQGVQLEMIFRAHSFIIVIIILIRLL